MYNLVGTHNGHKTNLGQYSTLEAALAAATQFANEDAEEGLGDTTDDYEIVSA